MARVLLISSCTRKVNIYLKAFQRYASKDDRFRLILFNTSEEAAKHSVNEVEELKTNPIVQSVSVLPAPFFYMRRPKILWILVFWLSLVIELISFGRKFRPEIVHGYFAGLEVPVCFFASEVFKISSIITAVGADVLIELPKYRKPPYKQLVRKLWDHFDRIIVVCRDIATRLIRQIGDPLIGKKVEIIPDGVDLERFKPKKKDSNGLFTLLCVASFFPKKGHMYLLRAMRILHEEGRNDIKLLLAGDGPLIDEAKRQVSSYKLDNLIEFVGFINHGEIPHLYGSADVLVLPSLFEGLPVVLLEAMASGLPVIATNVGGIPEIVKNMENGIVIPPMDEKSVANAIATLKDNPVLRGKMGRRGRAIAEEIYDVKNIVQKVRRIYLDLSRCCQTISKE